MIKRVFLLSLFVCLAAMLEAGITTYTFTSKTWGSQVGSEVCDRVTDGWTCDNEASEYMKGNGPDAQGHIQQRCECEDDNKRCRSDVG